MKTRQQQDRVTYVDARNEAERVKRRENTRTWRKLGEGLKEDHAGIRRLLYNLTSNNRGKNNANIRTMKKMKLQPLLDDIEESRLRYGMDK